MTPVSVVARSGGSWSIGPLSRPWRPRRSKVSVSGSGTYSSQASTVGCACSAFSSEASAGSTGASSAGSVSALSSATASSASATGASSSSASFLPDAKAARPRGSVVCGLLVGVSLTLLRLFHGRLVGLRRLRGRDGSRGSLAGGGNALGDGGGVDRGGLERVSLTALFNAGLANLAQTQELPAREEEREGNQREDTGGKERDDGEGVGVADLPGQRQGQVVGRPAADAARAERPDGTFSRSRLTVPSPLACLNHMSEEASCCTRSADDGSARGCAPDCTPD